jgi:Phosphatidylinositol N-acetylglucosaminyltransferase subunit Y
MEQAYVALEDSGDFQNEYDRPITTPSPDPEISGHRRSVSGSLLSKLSFLRASSDGNNNAIDRTQLSPEFATGEDRTSPKKTSRAMAAAVQQQKTRRRKGSLRKAALLGRGAQRERREMKASPLETGHEMMYAGDGTLSPTSPEEAPQPSGYGLGISEATPRPSMEGYASRANNVLLSPITSPITTLPMGTEDRVVSPPPSATSPTLTYTSTDEDDVLSIPNHSLPPPPRVPSTSSGSDSYFPPGAGSLARRRSQRAKSPLSLGGLAASPLPAPDAEWDYSETERWGWFVLIVTWIVFVTGMGSCLGVWSWAWDVGETPYAPPELEDDPTLPIVGYYPALIILTAVMAWVWVVVAWVGMKYFRHAKISGD